MTDVSGVCRPATGPNPRAIHLCPRCAFMAVATTPTASAAALDDHLAAVHIDAPHG